MWMEIGSLGELRVVRSLLYCIGCVGGGGGFYFNVDWQITAISGGWELDYF